MRLKRQMEIKNKQSIFKFPLFLLIGVIIFLLVLMLQVELVLHQIIPLFMLITQ